MILLLGATGYIGQAFATELQKRGAPFKQLSRREVDYTHFPTLWDYLKQTRPVFLINAAGYTGKPNVDACENARADTLLGNTLLPQTIGQACHGLAIPWGHVSSGCIYTGAKVREGDGYSVLKDMTTPEGNRLVREEPGLIEGFTEEDEPNFSFRQPPCSFYSGTKALGEEALQAFSNVYLWRLRIPFDEFDSGRNYLSKLQRYSKVYDNVNSISHRGDYVRACLDLWETRAPFGIYNVTNSGFTTAREVIALIQKHSPNPRGYSFWENDEEFYKVAARTPRSNCVMDNSKLLRAGVKMRSVQEALLDALSNWKPEAAQ